MPKNLDEVRSWIRTALANPGGAGSITVMCPRCDRVGIAVVDVETTREAQNLNVTITWKDRDYRWVERLVLAHELADPDFGCGFDSRGTEGRTHGASPEKDASAQPEARA